MPQLTVDEILREIAELGMEVIYEYASERSHSRMRITYIEYPEGPISFENLDDNGKVIRSANISKQSLAKIALVCSHKPNFPLHVDRVFSAGGNTRSALETLLLHTPHFFICYPQRVDPYSGEIRTNLKHLMWCPDETHPLGQIYEKQYDDIITEVELGVGFDKIQLTSSDLGSDFDDIETKRLHTQMQVALIEIGRALNFKSWIARNDHYIRVGDRHLGELEGTLASLDEARILYDARIKDAAALIDCIWFTQDGNRIPAVIEVEHSTGVRSGLLRMLKLREAAPAIETTFTIVAPNELRNRVIREANEPVFRDLKARYMPYSTVRELYGLIQKYTLAGYVDHNFVQPFMEKIVGD